MKPLKSLAIIISVFLILFFTAGVGLADVGNFNDYSDGGGWDVGGSWDSGSDYYGGDSIDLGSFGGSFLGSAMGSSFGSDYGDGGGGGLIFAIIFIVIIAFVVPMLKRRAGGTPSRAQNTRSVIPANNTALITDFIQKEDHNFSAEKFLGWVKEVFITLQQAWTQRSWEPIRPFEKEELFRQHEMQLNEYINSGRINIIERININQAYLTQYIRDKEYEYLKVYMQVRMVDYIIDENTKAVLKGDPNKDSYLQYILTFMRKDGVKTDPALSGKSTVSCPHCGAPTKVTSSGKCEYCGYIITTGEFDWVLSDITGVKPGTVIDNRPIIIEDDNKND